MSVSLGTLKIKEKGKIVGFLLASDMYRKKLLSMGIVKGEVCEVRRIAPLGDPVEIVVKGYRLSLRKEEAAAVLVERI